jgi:hypothetical protein
MTIKGNSRGNVLKGTGEADVIFGLGGDDRIVGDAGADVLYGDDDLLATSFGSGNDRLSGGAGADALVGGGGADTLIGGDGDDLLIGGFATGVVADGVNFSYGYSPFTDGGDDSYDGGTGFDRAILSFDRSAAIAFSIARPALGAITADGVQIGTIRGVEAIQAYLGSGDDIVSGGTSGDELRGRAGDDVLAGGDGSDRIDGGLGDDRLSGGDGYDILSYDDARAGVRLDLGAAGRAQDTVGAGVDTFDGFEQVDGSNFSDRIVGSAANDNMTSGNGGGDQLFGGDGNDQIALYHLPSETIVVSVVTGGRGDDVITIGAPAGSAERITVDGGLGDDLAYLQVAARQNVDMGGGEDRVVLQFGDGEVGITLGRGVDTVAFQVVSGFSASQVAAHVRDFAAGTNGDRIDLRDLLAGAATGYQAGSNPFATGHVRLVASGSGTALQFDADGVGTGSAFVTVLELDGTQPGTFTAFNFGGTDPRASVAATPMLDHHWPAFADLP